MNDKKSLDRGFAFISSLEIPICCLEEKYSYCGRKKDKRKIGYKQII